MARYKPIDSSPRFLAVDLERQLLPGTFEHALCYLVDHELDLSDLDRHYRNDLDGAPADPPATLLKVVLFAHSRGLISSRGIERACREHVTFIALSGASAPHFTTIAAFITRLRAADVARLFGQILVLCDRQGLIDREMFAIGGVLNQIARLGGHNSRRQRRHRLYSSIEDEEMIRLRHPKGHPLVLPGDYDECPFDGRWAMGTSRKKLPAELNKYLEWKYAVDRWVRPTEMRGYGNI